VSGEEKVKGVGGGSNQPGVFKNVGGGGSKTTESGGDRNKLLGFVRKWEGVQLLPRSLEKKGEGASGKWVTLGQAWGRRTLGMGGSHPVPRRTAAWGGEDRAVSTTGGPIL